MRVTMLGVCVLCLPGAAAFAQDAYVSDQATFTAGLDAFSVEDFESGPVEILSDDTLVYMDFSVRFENDAASSVNTGFLSTIGVDAGDFPAGVITYEFDQAVVAIGMDLLEVEGSGGVLITTDGAPLEKYLIAPDSLNGAPFTNGDFVVLEFAEAITSLTLTSGGGLSFGWDIDNLVIGYVPAPSAGALLMIAAGAGARRRR